MKINLLGYTRAGKSSLARSLLGKSFLESIESTEGIHTQLIITTYDPRNEVIGPWEEIHLDTEKISEDFNKKILSTKYEGHSSPGNASKETSISQNLEITVKEQAEVPSKDQQASKESFKVPYNLRRKRSYPASDSASNPKSLKRQKRTQMSVSGKRQDCITRQPAKASEEMSQAAPSVKLDPVTFRQLSKHMNSKRASHTNKDQDHNTECQIRLWDHGGQVEFLATHHLFLDADAINLIVMDITKKLHEDITSKYEKTNTEGVPRTGAQFLDYWFNNIHEKAAAEKSHPTVAIILTHLDQVTSTEANDYIYQLLHYRKDKVYCQYIDNNNIFMVDNKNGGISEFNHLRQHIFKMASLQNSWGTERPTRWLKLEASIHEEAKSKSSRHIHITRILELASGFGINKEEVDHFLQFHHSMGDFVHYSDEALKDLIITDPQWLVDMFKALITADEFLDRRSINQMVLKDYKRTALLSKSTLQALWKGQDFKFLTELMNKFQLIVPLTNSIKEYLVPCMTPPRQLSIYETKLFRDMTMVYSSPPTARSNKNENFLPVGSYHRLLALLSASTPWKLCVNDHLTYSDASFEVEYGVRVALTLLKHIRVTVWCGSPSYKKTALRLLPSIRKTINENSKKLLLRVHEKFLIMCPQQQLSEDLEEKGSCMIPVAATETSFVSQVKTCHQHNIPVQSNDFDWLLKVTVLPEMYTYKKFPKLQTLTKGKDLFKYTLCEQLYDCIICT